MALFLTFPHGKTFFQWSKAVSEAILLLPNCENAVVNLSPQWDIHDALLNTNLNNIKPMIKALNMTELVRDRARQWSDSGRMKSSASSNMISSKFQMIDTT